MKARRHNLSIQGKPGVITGVSLTGLIVIVNSLINQYTTGEGGTAFLPISFFEMLIAGIVLLFTVLCYFSIVLINRKHRRKGGFIGWEDSAKMIRKRFLFYLIVGGVFAVAALKIGDLKLVIPGALALYGLFCIRIQTFSHGNTNILGLFFVLQAILAYMIPSAAMVIAGVSMGGFHIVYAILLTVIPFRPRSPEGN